MENRTRIRKYSCRKTCLSQFVSVFALILACVTGGILSRVRQWRRSRQFSQRLLSILLATSPPVFTLRCQNFTSHANNPASYAGYVNLKTTSRSTVSFSLIPTFPTSSLSTEIGSLRQQGEVLQLYVVSVRRFLSPVS